MLKQDPLMQLFECSSSKWLEGSLDPNSWSDKNWQDDLVWHKKWFVKVTAAPEQLIKASDQVK